MIPGRPTPSPTTAVAPAPIKTNAKVPMNSARSLEAREFDIADLRRWLCIVLLAPARGARAGECLISESHAAGACKGLGVSSPIAPVADKTHPSPKGEMI